MSADDLALIAASEKAALEAAAKACFLDHRRRVRVARIEEFVRDYSEKSGDEQSLRVFQELPEGKKNRLDFISSREFDPVLTADDHSATDPRSRPPSAADDAFWQPWIPLRRVEDGFERPEACASKAPNPG